jgi:hypothetical protein
MARLLCIAAFVLLVIGCGPSSSSHSYTVTIQNQSKTPMTCWLTKNGPPAEVEWLSPEQIAVNGQPRGAQLWAIVVKPGTTIDTPRAVKGTFYEGVSAVMRVYRGEMKFNELLAISQDSPNRTDIKLSPGPNTILIDPYGNATKK